jgi:hypothetical protein
MSRQVFESDPAMADVHLRIRQLEERVQRLEETLHTVLASKDEPAHRVIDARR